MMGRQMKEAAEKRIARAIENVTDQALLAEIAISAKDNKACMAAVKKVTNKALLTKISEEAKSGTIRTLASSALKINCNRSRGGGEANRCFRVPQ